MNSITFVCSRVGGGKSFIGKSLFKGMPDSKSFVEVSDIVRDIIKKDEREHLVNKPELSGHIIEELKQVQSLSKYLIVSGVRQVSILEAFPDATLIWIEVDAMTRYDRFLHRTTDKQKDLNRTLEDFKRIEYLDEQLGVGLVKDYIFNHNKRTL